MNTGGLKAQVLERLNWGANTRLFLRGIFALAPFMVLSRLVAMTTHVLAGRWLGPNQYGMASLTLATGKLWLLFISLGFFTAVSRVAAVPEEKRTLAVSSLTWSILTWIGFCLLLLFIFHSPLARKFKISPEVYFWSVLYAGAQFLYATSSGLLAGLQKFKSRGIFELTYSAIVLVVFSASFIFNPQINFSLLLRAMSLGCALGSLLCFYEIREFIRPVFSFSAIRDVWDYAGPYLMAWGCMVGAESLVTLMVSWNLTSKELGFYSAYQTAIFRPVLVASALIGIVLGPISSVREKQKKIWKKFLGLSPLIFLIAWFVFSFAGSVVIKFMGKRYPLSFPWILTFGGAAAFFFMSAFPGTILSFRDSKSAWLSSFSSVWGAFLGAAIGFWAIPRFKIAGAALALMGLYAGSFLWNSISSHQVISSDDS